MKKLIMLITTVMLISVLAACGKQTATTEPDSKNEKETVEEHEAKHTIEEPETPAEDGDDYTVTYVGDDGNEIVDDEPGEMGNETLDDEDANSEDSDGTLHKIDDSEPEIENPDIEPVTDEGTDKLTVVNDEDGEQVFEIKVPVGATTTHSTIKKDDIITFTWDETENNARAYFRYNVTDGYNINAKIMRCIESYISNPDIASYNPKDDPSETINSAALINETFYIEDVYTSSKFGTIYLICTTHSCDPSEPECSNEMRYYAVCYDITNSNGDCLKLCYEDAAGYLVEHTGKLREYTKAILGVD